MSEETRMAMTRGTAEKARSRGTRFEPGSTWSTSREGRTGAAAAARRSSGTYPHTCTLTTVTGAPPAMGLLLASVSTTPHWPLPCPSHVRRNQRRRRTTKKKMRMKKRCRAMEEAWARPTVLPHKMVTSTSPLSLSRTSK